MDTTTDPNIPQWKKDLIKRLRNKHKWFEDCDSSEEQVEQLLTEASSVEVGYTVQQPNLTCSSSSTAAVVLPVHSGCDTRIPNEKLTMVKDRGVIDRDLENSCVGSDNEELHYGPGIVKKLKNHYLSLTLRECNAQVRPSILPLRKATSLENLLDDDAPNNKPSMHYSRYKPRYKENETKNFTNNRYYNASRGVDLKRARSVEAISRSDEPLNESRLKHQSFHEEMLIVTEGNGVSENTHRDDTKETTKPFSNTVNHKINRPKRITPLMSEKEKPPVDVVKQTKRIFEGKAEQRTKQPYQTGDVAAKVASYKNIIQTKNNNKKPPVKQKPVLPEDNRKTTPLLKQNGWKNENKQSKSPPDVSLVASPREENNRVQPNLSETPDLILHSSPVKNLNSSGFKIQTTDNFLQTEIMHSNHAWVNKTNDDLDGPKIPTPSKSDTHTSPTFTNISLRKHQLPDIKTDDFRVVSPILLGPLTLQEIEKNHINTTKIAPKVSTPLLARVDNAKNGEVIKKIQLPKKHSRSCNEQNSIVFKFTDRSDVPDYVHNDGKIRTGKIEKPKVGEGGIILLPGISLDESLVDDEDDWMLILEGPPSPCNVEFINGNVLIDGRSSLSQKGKKSQMRIKFVETLPEIYEYPSETSLTSDYNHATSPVIETPSVVNNTLPTLTGTSLANYVPKLGLSEDFQLGITRSTPNTTSLPSPIKAAVFEEEELPQEPVLFSAGTNSDILF